LPCGSSAPPRWTPASTLRSPPFPGPRKRRRVGEPPFPFHHRGQDLGHDSILGRRRIQQQLKQHLPLELLNGVDDDTAFAPADTPRRPDASRRQYLDAQ
jgi:hypothetical protein